MGELLGFNIPLNMPKFGVGTGNIYLIAIIFIFIFAIAIVIYVVLQWMTYNRKIIVFENISGLGFQPTFRDTARLVKLGDGGEELLYLRKKKVYRTAYGKKMGKNTYWFAVGQDGYWYNCVLGDIDAKMGMLDIEPIDRDMRYMHVAIRKNIDSSYNKQKFMDKYGSYVMSGIFLIIMLGGIWFLLDKMVQVSDSINIGVKTATTVVDKAAEILSSLDNICTGGSGIKPI
jgi:hypothetical protein